MSVRSMSKLSLVKNLGCKYGKQSRSGESVITGVCTRSYTAFRKPEAYVQQLKMFPEYTTAIDFETIGNYTKAIPLYQRMHEVISSAMGTSSPLAMELTFNTALLQKQSGNYDRAIQTISSTIKDAKTKVDNVRLHELLAVCHLLKGDFPKAVEVATTTVDLCEAHEDHVEEENADELALFSPSYSILGVSSLFSGDLDTAETFLQLAARWAQPGQVAHQVSALSNLGLLTLYKIGTEGYPTASEHAYLAKGAPALRRLTTTTAAGVNRKELPKHPLVAEAVAYWQGALDIVNEANSANVASQAAAMCGVPTNAAPDMTGLGGKARMVTSTITDSGSSGTGGDDNKGNNVQAENLLLEPSVMSAYTTVLTNFAELYELSGDLNHKEEYLSAALTVLKNYEAQLSTTDTASGEAQSSGETSAKGVFPLSQVQHKPLLGRVLSLVAHRELSVGQTVVAEGLYRSAIDNLNTPAALHDPRYQHEKAIAQGGYGLLLTRWDKRATSGEELMKQAQDLYASVPAARLLADSGSVGDSSVEGSGSDGVVVIPLTGMLQLPL